MKAVANGELTLSEAGDLICMVESFAKTLQVSDLEQRLERLEKASADKLANDLSRALLA